MPHGPSGWTGQNYRQFRPDYPAALFHWLQDNCPARQRAWDCGCGSGQASLALAAHFHQVIASDPSASQLAAFIAPANCLRVQALAEAAPLANNSVDLIAIAQALHWFHLPSFTNEAQRVARPGALLAAWSYGLCQIEGDHGGLLEDFHDNALARWWAPQRARVINGYRDARLPGEPLTPPAMTIERHWHCDQMLGYLGTWSALVSARQHGEDPLERLAGRLQRFWGEQPRRVSWPLHIRAVRL